MKTDRSGATTSFVRSLAIVLAVLVLASVFGAWLGGGEAKAAGASAPSAPSGVVATAGAADAHLTWTAPAKSGSSPLTGYFVTIHGGSATHNPEWFAGTATTATVNNLVNGTGYQFTVVAANAAGSSLASGWSNYVIPSTLPSAPTNVIATNGEGQATVSWTAPANNGRVISAYMVTPYADGVAQPVKAYNTATSQVIYSLGSSKTWTFRVAAVNSNGTGPASALSGSVTPTALPTAPRSVVAVAGSGQVALSWTAPASSGNLPLTGYEVTAHNGTVNGTPQWFAPTTSATSSPWSPSTPMAPAPYHPGPTT
jgi:hypothetical protein